MNKSKYTGLGLRWCSIWHRGRSVCGAGCDLADELASPSGSRLRSFRRQGSECPQCATVHKSHEVKADS